MGSFERTKQSNIQRFLNKITPFVASQSLPKTSIQNSDSLQWQSIGKEKVDYFTLGDLWDQYYEYSVCGLGIPVHIANEDSVVQYYVPHLSGIQLYTSKSISNLRNVEEESESDSFSDDSDQSEKLSKSWDATSDESASELDGSWPKKGRIGQLYLQYIEYCPPYARIPLTDKVMELARTYPGLLSLKSTELSPASWMSISWYPICHLPAQRNLKDLGASFLTFHTISSTFLDDISEYTESDSFPCMKMDFKRESKDGVRLISLPPFGLATYKMQGSYWINPAMGDYDTLGSLYGAADSWLKQLRIDHHDFNFFTTH